MEINRFYLASHAFVLLALRLAVAFYLLRGWTAFVLLALGAAASEVGLADSFYLL